MNKTYCDKCGREINPESVFPIWDSESKVYFIDVSTNEGYSSAERIELCKSCFVFIKRGMGELTWRFKRPCGV